MTVSQTVNLPASHRLVIDVPREVPEGPIVLTFSTVSKPQEKERSPLDIFCSLAGIDKKNVQPFSSLWGLHKGRDTMEAYFERKRADKAKEDAQILRHLGLDELPVIKKEG
jgi:hypothetical protein